MIILALDSSSVSAGVCLMEDGRLIYQAGADVGLKHSVVLMPMVQGCLGAAGLSTADVGLFAVTAGPGSFTGVRIGISCVKGMAWALNRPCAAVSSMEALACNVSELYSDETLICSAFDARRDQVYCAVFRAGGEHPVRLTQDDALPVRQAAEAVDGFEGRQVVFVGDGAARCFEEYQKIGRLGGFMAPQGLINIQAGSVARLARRDCEQGRVLDAGSLAPVYLRVPQAERERAQRMENSFKK